MNRNDLKKLAKMKNLDINFGKMTSMNKERWKKYSNILVSNYGNVKDASTLEKLEPIIRYSKYNSPRSYVKTDNGTKYLTWIVYDLFNNIDRKGLEVHHIDEDSLNNRADNLIAVTKSVHHKLHTKPRTHHNEINVTSEDTKKQKRHKKNITNKDTIKQNKKERNENIVEITKQCFQKYGKVNKKTLTLFGVEDNTSPYVYYYKHHLL